MQLWVISLATVSVAVAAPAFPNDDQFESFSEVYDDNIAMPSSVHRRFQAPVQRVPAEFGHTIESANYRNMLRNPNYAMQQRLPLRNQNKMYQSTYFPSEDYFYNPFQNQQFYFRGQQYYPQVNPYEEFDYQFDYPQVVFFSIRQPYNRNPYLSDAPRPYPLATFNPTVPQEETNREQDAVTPVYIETPFGNSGDLSNNKAETEISEKPADGVAEQRGEVDKIILQKESAVQFGDEELELRIAADDETKATIESSAEMAMEDEFEGSGKRSMDLAESAIIEAASEEEEDDDDDLSVRNPFPEAFLENSKDNEELKNVIG